MKELPDWCIVDRHELIEVTTMSDNTRNYIPGPVNITDRDFSPIHYTCTSYWEDKQQEHIYNWGWDFIGRPAGRPITWPNLAGKNGYRDIKEARIDALSMLAKYYPEHSHAILVRFAMQKKLKDERTQARRNS